MSAKAKKKSKKWIVWTIILLIVAVLIASPFIFPKALSGEEVEAKKGDITTYYNFSGNIQAVNSEKVYAESAILIKEIKVSQGTSVKKDDVIYTTALGDVKAKIGGEVDEIYVAEGEQLMPGSPIMNIIDYSKLELTVKVDEYDVSAIVKDEKATVTIQALGKDIEGTVKKVSRTATNLNGVSFFTATIDVPQDETIKIGMTAEAKVMKDSVKDVTIIPVSCVHFNDNNEPYVEIKVDNKLEKKDIELGVSDGVTAEVKSGLSAGDKVYVEKSTLGSNPWMMRGRNQEVTTND